MKISIAITIVMLMFLVLTLNAAIWYVHPDSTLNSIQDALNTCSANDTVLVGPGLYYENINWPNVQGIDLIGEEGPDTTTINGNGAGTVIYMNVVVDSATIISGFTIENGYAINGGGIHCRNNASATICNNVITYNIADSCGGGIRCDSASPVISDNAIIENTAYLRGGGIYCYRSSGIISNNQLNYNSPTITAAIDCRYSSGVISNNQINGNISSGIACSGFVGVIKDNDISLNNTHGLIAQACSATICCNNFSNNGAVGILCYQSSLIIDTCTITGNSYGVFSSGFCDATLRFCNIMGNTHRGIENDCASDTIDAIYNWWGDATGPYHSILNPGGLGDTVSDYVVFDPWLSWPVGVEERPIVKPVETHENLAATMFRGPLRLPEGKKCKVFDITGRVVEPDKIQPGIYFIEINGVVIQKVVQVN